MAEPLGHPPIPPPVPRGAAPVKPIPVAPQPATGDQARASKSPRMSVLGIATILLLLVTGLLAAGKFWWNANHLAKTKPRTRVVRVVRPIPAFTRITAADVRADSDTARVRGGVETDPAKVVGRVVTTPLDSGALLPSRRLLDLDGEWVVLSMGTDSVLAGRAGDTISLLAGMSPDTAKELVNATAVSLGTRGAKTYLAVRPADLQRFAAFYQKDPRFLAVRRIPSRHFEANPTNSTPPSPPPAAVHSTTREQQRGASPD